MLSTIEFSCLINLKTTSKVLKAGFIFALVVIDWYGKSKDIQKALKRDCIYNIEITALEIGVSGVYLHLL